MRFRFLWQALLGCLCAVAGAQASDTLWIRNGRVTPAGLQLVSELAQVEKRGLLPRDYDATGLSVRVQAAGMSNTPEALALLDTALSAAAARLVSDLHDGRIDPRAIGYDLDIPRPRFDVTAAVASLAASTDVAVALDSLEPQLRHYALLKAALAQYRALASASAGLVQLPALPRTPIRPGERYDGAPALRRLLTVLGDVAAVPGPTVADDASLDPGLVEALKQFQVRHGLDADGVLGRSTFHALTVPFSARVQQIELSLERVRWLPPRLDSPPIIVNIPQFRLFAFRTTQDFAQDILQMNVIVGATFEGRRTPVFAADMKYIVLQPYWDVPRSILVNELLPEIRANPAWVEKNGYEMVRGESDEARALPVTLENVQLLAQGKLRLRQKPGPENALGHVKFIFPNRHNVYLHDTPARGLFARSRRAFSHGCIRVSDPMALLAHVMRDDPAWSEVRRDQALKSTTPVRVPLQRPIRVFILYGTALATEAGKVLFFDDIYAQDAPLIARLSGRRPLG